MDYCRKLIPGLGALALTLVFPCLTRAEKLNLDRITPVPANEPIPAIDFFRSELLRSPTVNLAGTQVAALVAAGEDHTSLMVYDLKTQKMESHESRGDSDITFVQWLTDDLLVFMINYQKGGNYVFCAGHPGALDQSYPLLQNVPGSFIVSPPNDRTRPLARLGPNTSNTGKYGEVVTLDAKINRGSLLDLSGDGALMGGQQLADVTEANMHHIVGTHPILETPNGFDLFYNADKEGKLAFGVSSTLGVLALHRLDGDKWVKCPEDLDEMTVVDTGNNPGEIVVVGARREGKPRALEVLNAADGTLSGTLLDDPGYDFNGWLYRDPVSRTILGAVYDSAVPKVVWFDEGMKKLQNSLEKLPVFQGQVVRIVGNNADRSGILIQAFSDTHPSGYYWADLKAKTFGPIKNSRPWIDPGRMQPEGMIKFKTRDGHKLDAYVTLPAGTSKKNPAPLVVLPHSWYQADRTTWGFNAEVQFFVSRGYAVLQPNYRGSAGYTGLFSIADEWDFRKMYEDVADATKAIIASGIVDKNRVAIVGTSFGGFLALSGAAYEPGIYQCAVAISPIALDLAKYIEENKYNQFSDPTYSRLVYKLGDPKTDTAKYEALSPLRHAEQIQAAVLICNGQYDPTFVTNESKELVSIVKRNHPTSDTIYFLNEAGGVRHLSNKVELYTRIENFLAQNLGRTGTQ